MTFVIDKTKTLRERWVASVQATHRWQGREPDPAEELSKAFDDITRKMTRQRKETFVSNAEGHTIILYHRG